MRARTAGLGPRAFAGLRLIVRLGAVDRAAWAAAMGWSQTTAYDHAIRLEQIGLVRRQLTHSRSLLVASAEGAAFVGREDLGRGSAAGASTWAHARAVSWVAAAFEREGSRWLSERELRLEEAFWRLQVASQDGASSRRRSGHFPDLGLVTEERRAVAYEVELQSKRKTRVRDLLAAYKKRLAKAGDELDAVVYVVDSPRVAKLVSGIAQDLAIEEAVTIRRLDELIVQAQETSGQKSAGEKGGNRARSVVSRG